ncbi:hypothetical protein B7486_55560 [cyanobacterium TDX16]|nr:hypothetical protein B7486_55560 [cyanobacterium TDX16]
MLTFPFRVLHPELAAAVVGLVVLGLTFVAYDAGDPIWLPPLVAGGGVFLRNSELRNRFGARGDDARRILHAVAHGDDVGDPRLADRTVRHAHQAIDSWTRRPGDMVVLGAIAVLGSIALVAGLFGPETTPRWERSFWSALGVALFVVYGRSLRTFGKRSKAARARARAAEAAAMALRPEGASPINVERPGWNDHVVTL